MEDDRDSILDAAAERYWQGERNAALAKAAANRVDYWPSPNSRVAHALNKAGLYIPARLKGEINDAAQAIFVEAGGVNNEEKNLASDKLFSISPRTITLAGTAYNFRAQIKFPKAEREKCETSIREFIQENGLGKSIYLSINDDSIELCTVDIESALRVIVDGYINKNYPQYAVDYRKIIQEEAPGLDSKKSWVGRG